MSKSLRTEAEMLWPVLRLFPKTRYTRLSEVPLGRKLIDLLCLPRQATDESVSVELKLRDWRKALWQAIANFQLTDQSFIAISQEFAHRPQSNLDLLEFYGIGLIIVQCGDARIVRPSKDTVYRIARRDKAAFYKHILEGATEGL